MYGEARFENFPSVNAYRNPIIAEAMKVMKYVNMFNRGVSRIQEYLMTALYQCPSLVCFLHGAWNNRVIAMKKVFAEKAGKTMKNS
ncbi:hypothetical protein [Parabacteroides sp.]